MDWKELYRTLDALFDAESCINITKAIWENDRWCSRDKNGLTAHYCAEVLRSAGLSEVELLPLTADGKTKYFDWTIPRAWDADSATLHYAHGEKICDYAEKPCCLVMYSPSTPAEGVEAEAIIPDRADPDPEKYRGKILLVGDPASSWTDFAAKWGAVGILSDFMPLTSARSSREDLYDDVVWMGMGSVIDHNVFAFHLTARQADRMREELKNGPVRVKAKVSTRSYDGMIYTVSAALPGTDPAAPEIFLYGHLCEPGANDNAAGAAAILHLAQIYAKAVADGTLPRPKRTIRFAMGYECGGSMGYMAAHGHRPVLCGMVADMIAAEAGDNAIMGLRYDPLSNWSFADGALLALSDIAQEQENKTIPYDHVRFSIGTDNIIADPLFRRPTVAMVACPALSYHSSFDTPERIEPETLKRNALIAGTYVWGFANAGEDDCAFLADAIRARTNAMIAEIPHPRHKRLLEEAQALALHSLNRISESVSYPVASFSTEPAPDWAKSAENRIPERIMLGALTFKGERNGKIFNAAWSGDMNIPIFWIDGKRNLWQIAYLSAVEKGKCTDAEIKDELELLTDYFDCLAEHNYIRWL